MRLLKPIAALVLFLFLLIAPAGAEISFVQPLGNPLISTTNGGGVIGVATGDFDGDGIVDLAVTRFDGVATGGQQGFVAVMRGKGDGTFQAPIPLLTLPVNVFAIGILAKDFDGDGKLDLVVAVYPSHQILFFKGTGSPGTIMFNAPVVTNTTHQPQGLQAADLNGDGKLDLVTANPADNTVSVLLNLNVQSTGTFEPPTDYPVGSNPLDVAIGDVDGIKGPDLVVGNNGSATISVLLNNGNGTFGALTSFNARLRPLGLYLADFDGDGKLDVVAAGNECNSPPPPIAASGCMVFMKGQGNGSFAVPTDQNFTGLDSPPTAHLWTENAALELNGDGKPDVVFVPSQGGGFGKSVVAVGLNTGDGTGRFHVSYWVGAPPQPTTSANPDFVQGVAAVVADFDGDGVLDLAYATQGKDNTRGAVSILFGDMPGTFEVPRSYSAFARNFGGDGAPQPYGGVFGAFTSSGKADLAVLSGNNGCPEENPLLDVFPGNGDGSLGDPVAAAHASCAGGGNIRLRSADLDKDGKLDLVFLGFNNGLGQNQGVVASGNGNGTFTLFSSFPLAMGQGQGSNMVLGDFNDDGFPDVAVFVSLGCFFPNADTNIEVLLQGAGGTKTFTSKSVLPVNGLCGGGLGIVAARFDNKGKIDLVAQIGTGGFMNDVVLFKGKGDGTFEAPTVIATGVLDVAEYVTADVNNDGNLDLVGAGRGTVYVHLGNGDGTFQAPVAYGFGGFCDAQSCGVRVADFDGDGHPDIAVVGSDPVTEGFAVLRNNGNGTFESPIKFAVGATGTSWLDVADVNGDGQPDVVIGHGGQNGDNFTVLINDSRPVADLAISKADSPDPVILGNNLTYTITVTNAGPGLAPGVTVTDPLPATVNFVSATPSQGSCSGTTTVSCNLGFLANGGAATVTIVVTPMQAGGISNTASVAANVIDPNLNNNSATQDTTIHPAPPDTAITTHPATLTNSTSATFEFTATAAGTFQCNLDGGGFSACTTPKSYNGLAAGPHTFQVRAVDTFNDADPTPASFNWTIDTAAPDTVIDSGPANPTNSTSASFTFHATEAGSSFACQLDSGGFSNCTSPKNYAGLAASAHTFDVKATDGAGNTDPTPASFNWTITPAPDTIINSGPTAASGGATNSSTAIFNFSSTDSSATFACSIDSGAFAACTSPKTYSKLKTGAHNFKVQATAGGLTDPTPASFDWTIDTTIPNTTITSGPAALTNNPVATFTFTSTEAGSSFQCSLDGSVFVSCTSPFVSSPLADGKHAFQVRAVDAAGNVDKSPAKAKAWTVDATRPITTITSKPTDPTTSTSVAFKFTSEKNSTFQCSLDGGAFTSCKSGQKYSGLLPGPHNFQVQATDAAGNVELTPVSYSWTQN